MTALAPPSAYPLFNTSAREPSPARSRPGLRERRGFLTASGYAEHHTRLYKVKGLPTPPETRAMTGFCYQNGQSSYNQDPSFYQPPYSSQPAAQTHQLRWNPQVDINDRSLPSASAAIQNPQKPQEGHHESTQKANNDSIASFLRIPEAIDRNGGSLTELAAEITCLFWFESAATLQTVEQSFPTVPFTKPLAPDTTPTMGFRKWVTTILSTTQVTRNVIILALLFIYRLKKSNPHVSGKQGSEFRLLTIALMLGNKFLDDNTYTNKTWAEVSGISVSEIHVMEVEFLSNMRYNLYVSLEKWEEWMAKVAKFRKFFINSARVAEQRTCGVTPLSIFASPHHKLPSPPSPIHNQVQNYPTPVSFSHPSSQRSSPSRGLTESLLNPRKRSLDDPSEAPQPKRTAQALTPTSLGSYPLSSSRPPAMYNPTPSATLNPGPQENPNLSNYTALSSSIIPRLPMPRIQTNLDSGAASIQAWNNQLPLPSSRAMSSVYPSSSSWTQPTTPTSTVPSNSLNQYHGSVTTLPESSQTNTPFAVRSGYGSPVHPNLHTLTPTTHLSPSMFPTNRNSPYRPIRAVNTLLYPPPSTSLQNPSRNITLDQMYYQPLSKQATEPKVGVVPYLHHDPWAIPPSHANTNAARPYPYAR